VLRAGRPGPRVADNAAWILAHGLSES
jgi:hypothetical protein